MLNVAAQGLWHVWAGQFPLEEDSGCAKHSKSYLFFIRDYGCFVNVCYFWFIEAPESLNYGSFLHKEFLC